MAQVKSFSWTNPSPTVVRTLDIGFDITKIEVIDVTAGAKGEWVFGMPVGSLQAADGTVTLTNGVTPLDEQAIFGAPITALTKGATTVITIAFEDRFEYVEGDKVRAVSIVDTGAAETLNREYTVTSVSGNQITCSDDTSSGFNTYVSYGLLNRIQNKDGRPYSRKNVAISGCTLGTSIVGAAGSEMVAVVYGEESVV